MRAVFHMSGIIALAMERFKIFVWKDIPLSPMFLSIMGDMPSGPIALDGFVRLNVAFTWSSVNAVRLPLVRRFWICRFCLFCGLGVE